MHCCESNNFLLIVLQLITVNTIIYTINWMGSIEKSTSNQDVQCQNSASESNMHFQSETYHWCFVKYRQRAKLSPVYYWFERTYSLYQSTWTHKNEHTREQSFKRSDIRHLSTMLLQLDSKKGTLFTVTNFGLACYNNTNLCSFFLFLHRRKLSQTGKALNKARKNEKNAKKQEWGRVLFHFVGKSTLVCFTLWVGNATQSRQIDLVTNYKYYKL